VLFAFGILGFALLILAFGQPLGDISLLPVVVVWLVGGCAFVWWVDRRLRGSR
jgi:hypothetical protein